MKKLIKKLCVLLGPFLLIMVFFFCADPMRIIYTYSSPTTKGVLMNDRLFQARYLEDNAAKYHSFILGSSRSKAFKTESWNRVSGTDSSFHLGVNDETLFGIEKKLEYLDKKGVKIKDVLILLDHRILSLSKNQQAHIFREHPSVSGESTLEFYKKFFVGFFKPEFLRAYIDWQYSGVYKLYMKNYIFKEDFQYNAGSGDIDYTGYEKEIEQDSTGYYEVNKTVFYQRVEKAAAPSLSEEGKALLLKTKEILQKQQARYKIILTPNYDEEKINAEDLDFLKDTFGAAAVYDFSGKSDITAEIGNYYEEKHFKPYIAEELMKRVYE